MKHKKICYHVSDTRFDPFNLQSFMDVVSQTHEQAVRIKQLCYTQQSSQPLSQTRLHLIHLGLSVLSRILLGYTCVKWEK